MELSNLHFNEKDKLLTRMSSIYLNLIDDNNYTPIVSDYLVDMERRFTFDSDALKIVINNFPKIPKDINIDSFIDFKSDPDTKLKLHRLRDWTTDISKRNFNEKEATQKLESLLDEYSIPHADS
jgi:hypothetical protein